MDARLTMKHSTELFNISWRINLTTGEKEAPLSEQGKIIIAMYLLVLGWLSWLGNSIVIFILYRQRHALQPTDLLTINLAISDASIAVFGFSRGTVELFNIFKDDGYVITWIWTCQMNGFLTLLFGLASINTLTVISVTRYIKGCHVNKGYYLKRSTISTSMTCIWMEAFFWAVVPLLGWASYTDTGYGTCAVDWSKAKYSTTYKSFIITLIITCFAVPVLIMIFSYLSIIKKEKGRNVMSTDSYFYKRRKVEKDMTRVSIAICVAFVLAWSPYMLVSTCSALGLNVPDSTKLISNLLAKSACCYNIFIYLIMSSKFRKDVISLVPCLPETKDHVRLQHFKALKPMADSTPRDVNQAIMDLLVEDKNAGLNSSLHRPSLIRNDQDSTCQSEKF